jgi:tRNA G18 (ribose-2'-O)-methylase SpoU
MNIRIESLDNPQLDVFRNLKAGNAVRDARLFIAEGPTVVDRVLRSDFQVQSILISDRKWSAFESRLRPDVTVFRLANDLADQLVGFSFHCGVLASVVRKPASTISSWMPTDGPALIIAGDRITDPENVGALVRIGSAFGAAAVVFGKGSADPFSRRVLRVSMGNVLYMPIIETDDLGCYLSTLQHEHQCTVCSTVLHTDATPLATFRFPERTVLVFGNEYDGISSQHQSIAATSLTIPMLNGTDSLNVAVSAGIFAHQYRSQFPVHSFS